MSLGIKILVCFLAGLGAGVGTGFAGMSAAAVIGPMLITFLGVPAYQAVGIGLASDVLASAVSAWTYKKSGNLDVKNSLVLLASVLCATVAGSLAAKLVPERAMSGTMQIAMIVLGLKFIVKPVVTTKEQMLEQSRKSQIIKSVFGGVAIGFICGFVGAGGGMMMLLVLTSVLGYELKTAVGTSVFIMSATALTGAVSHFAIGGFPDLLPLILCVLSTLLFAQLAALIANRVQPKVLNRATGVLLVLLGTVILAVNLF